MEIEFKAVDSLIASEDNPKKHNDKQIKKIISSIKEFGFNVPILADKENKIVCGNARVMAAKKMDLSTVPVIKIEHLNDYQKKAFSIAENRLSEIGGGWDDELLKINFNDLESASFDLSLTGFEEWEYLKRKNRDDNFEAENKTPQLNKYDATTRYGDVWQLGKHRLLCGDSTQREEIKEFIGSDSLSLMFTDPPYGVNYTSKKQGKVINDVSQAVIPCSFVVACEVLSDDARIYVCGVSKNIQMHVSVFNQNIYMNPCIIIWVKERFVMMHSHYHSQFEIVFFGWKGKGGSDKYWYGGRDSDSCSDVFTIARDHSKDYIHPTQKPVELSARCITNSSRKGDLVYEPFGGSGSTLIACEKLGRRCRAVELSPFFCDVIIKRWQDYTGESAMHATKNITFAELDDERKKTDSH